MFPYSYLSRGGGRFAPIHTVSVPLTSVSLDTEAMGTRSEDGDQVHLCIVTAKTGPGCVRSSVEVGDVSGFSTKDPTKNRSAFHDSDLRHV